MNVGARVRVSPNRVEVLADASGVPVPRVDGAPVEVWLSLSHRAERAMAAVAPTAVGCDLEVVEPRSDAFVGEWLAPAEQELVRAACGDRRDLLANLVWTAKEASAKARAGGLRLNVRDAEDKAVLEINSRFRTLGEKRALLRVMEMAQATSREKLRVKTNQFQVQAALLPDVLQLRAELANATDQYQQTLLAFWTAKADFDQALGEEVIK